MRRTKLLILLLCVSFLAIAGCVASSDPADDGDLDTENDGAADADTDKEIVADDESALSETDGDRESEQEPADGDAVDDQDTEALTDGDSDRDSEAEESPPEIWVDPATNLIWQVVPLSDWPFILGSDNDRCPTLTIGGFTGWRLPTIDELRSLIRGCLPTMTGGACPITESCIRTESCGTQLCEGCSGMFGPADGYYMPSELRPDPWGTVLLSSDAHFEESGRKHGSMIYYLVDFARGAVVIKPWLEKAGWRCVHDAFIDGDSDTEREEELSESEGDDDLSNATWTDPKSGLMWEVVPQSETMYGYYTSREYCMYFNRKGGFSDWREPDITELRSLIRGCEATMTGGACPTSSNDNPWDPATRPEICNGCASNQGPANGYYMPSELLPDPWDNLMWSISGAWNEPFYPGGHGKYHFFGVSFSSGGITVMPEGMLSGVRCVRTVDGDSEGELGETGEGEMDEAGESADTSAPAAQESPMTWLTKLRAWL